VPKIGEFHVAKRQADPNAEPLTFELEGETFTVSDTIGLAPLADFAHAAVSGLDTSDMEGMAAIRTMLRNCVIPDDSDRLWHVVATSRAEVDDLLPIVQAVIEAQTGKDTPKPSDSLPGLSSATASSM
jgi:hypothetical protein